MGSGGIDIEKESATWHEMVPHPIQRRRCLAGI
jgi:hypothetical protein